MTTSSKFLAAIVLTAVASAPGCFSGDMPPHPAIACRSDVDCPASFVCAPALHRCVVAATFGDACGDGALGGDEQCDEGPGNDDSRPDACRTDCRRPHCGDGTLDTGEGCDDGDANSDDAPNACRTTCARAQCGDGVIDRGEGCDDGAGNSDATADACRTSCTFALCGDGVQDADEECDDGTANSDVVADACRTSCVLSHCGDAVKDAGEPCDDGVANSDVDADACRTKCERARCGDGQQDTGEACDDGNVIDGDGCRGDCSKRERCGDGVVDRGEACDDGNANPADGCDACRVQEWTRELVVSGGVEGRDATGIAIQPAGLALDVSGRLFIADGSSRVLRLDSDGTMTVVAGNGERGTSDDGVRATSARVDPSDIAVDGRGRILIAEGARLRRVDEQGMLTTVAGAGTTPNTGDGGPAIAAGFFDVTSVAVDARGRIYVLDGTARRVRRIDVDGTIETVAGVGGDDGQGETSGDGGPAVAARLGYVVSVSVSRQDELLITARDRVRRVDSAGIITTVVGGGSGAGDGLDALTAGLGFDTGYARDPSGRLLIADGINNQVVRLEDNGTLTTVAGRKEYGIFVENGAGDGGPARDAELSYPVGLAVDHAGRIYIADAGNHRVRRVDVDGTITTAVGGGHRPAVQGSTVALPSISALAVGPDGRVYIATVGRLHALDRTGSLTTITGKDGATDLRFRFPSGLAVNAAGEIFVANHFTDAIERIDVDGTVTRIAGGRYTSVRGDGDGGPALASAFSSSPDALAFDLEGRLLVIDGDRVRRIELDGTIDTIAGGGSPVGGGFAGDGGPATAASLRFPTGLAIDPVGRVVIADYFHDRVRRIEFDSTITTIVGTFAGAAGDGGPATAARLDGPMGVAFDHAGRLLIVDTYNQRIRRVDVDGTISTVAVTAAPGADTTIHNATTIAVDELNNIYISDSVPQSEFFTYGPADHFVRRIDPNGIITTVAGGGELPPVSLFGDGGPAAAAGLALPMAVAVDEQDRLYVADSGNNTVRRVDVDGTITTVAGAGPRGDSVDGAPAALARLDFPNALAIDPLGRVVIYDSGNGRIVRVEPDGTLTNVAGGGDDFLIDDGAPATSGSLDLTYIGAMAFDAAGRLYFTERNPGTIRRVELDGTLTTPVQLTGGRCEPVALLVEPDGRLLTTDGCAAGYGVLVIDPDGTISTLVGGAGYGDGLVATNAQLFDARAASSAPAGQLFVVEDDRLRKVGADGAITSVVGRVPGVSLGDGDDARLAPLANAADVVADDDGLPTISDRGHNRVRRLKADGTIETVAGNGEPFFAGAGHPGLTSQGSVEGIALDAAGRPVYVRRSAARIQRLESDGSVTTIAGTGATGLSFDGLLATQTPIAPIGPIAVAADGRVFFVDEGSYGITIGEEQGYVLRIRCVEVDGTVSTVIGPPIDLDAFVFTSTALSGVPAAEWNVQGVSALAVDAGGSLLWSQDSMIWRVVNDGTVAAARDFIDGPPGRFGGMAPDADRASALAVDLQGRILFVEHDKGMVRRLEDNGTTTTIAGGGVDVVGDGVAGGAIRATDAALAPYSIAVDRLGRVWIEDFRRIYRVELDGSLVTVAGSATDVDGPSRDGASARDVFLGLGFGDHPPLVVDDDGRVFFGSPDIRRIDIDGTLTTVVGAVHPTGPGPFAAAKLYASRALVGLPDDRLVSVGDFGRALVLDTLAETVDVVVGHPNGRAEAASQARYAPLLEDARGVAYDPVAQTLVITEHDSHALRVIGIDVDHDGVVDDPALWTSTRLPTALVGPTGIAYDPTTQSFVVADEDAACVRRIGRDGTMQGTLLGRCGATGSFAGFLDGPSQVAVSPTTGAVYVSDTNNNRVLRVRGDQISVVLGDGSVSSAGAGRPARRFPVNAPRQLAVDAHGNLFVTSTTSVRLIANVDGDADADGDDEVFTVYAGDDRKNFPESDSLCLQALTLVGDELYVADACQGFVVRVTRSLVSTP